MSLAMKTRDVIGVSRSVPSHSLFNSRLLLVRLSVAHLVLFHSVNKLFVRCR